MTQSDLSHLAKLPKDRGVKAVAVAGNTGPYGGVLAKFRMYNDATEVVVIISGPALALFRSFEKAKSVGQLPAIDNETIEQLMAQRPTIEDQDWVLFDEPQNVAAQTKMLAAPTATALEFVTQDGKTRRYSLPLKVARFLADFLIEYRTTFEDHAG